MSYFSFQTTLLMNTKQDIADICNFLVYKHNLVSWDELHDWGILSDAAMERADELGENGEEPEEYPETILESDIEEQLPLGLHYINLEKTFDRTGKITTQMWIPLNMYKNPETPSQFISRGPTKDELFTY